MSIDIKPHAYDPATQPELFEGVLARRVVAFIVDFVIISIPVVLAAMFIFAFGFGMRVMDLEMRTWYGAPAYFVLGAVHAVAFWFTVSFFTPFVLLVAFFNERGRLLHDIILGTVIINNAARASVLRASMQSVRAG